jgi:hypothetical protein
MKDNGTHLNLHRQTVCRYMAADQFFEFAHRHQAASTMVPFMKRVRQRLAQGCHSFIQPWHELQGKGYKGSYSRR